MTDLTWALPLIVLGTGVAGFLAGKLHEQCDE